MNDTLIIFEVREPMENGDRFSIHFWSYYHENMGTRKKGEVLGVTVLRTSPTTLDYAVSRAREIWVQWMKKYSGCMAEMWIHKDDGQPKVGKQGAIFYGGNLDKFKPGSKAAEKTPF